MTALFLYIFPSSNAALLTCPNNINYAIILLIEKIDKKITFYAKIFYFRGGIIR